MSDTSYLLTLSCPNRPGIVARVTAELFSHDGNILEAHQFDDTETGRFFTRIVFNLHDDQAISNLVAGFNPIGDDCQMTWRSGGGMKAARCCCWCRNSTIALSTCYIAGVSASSGWMWSASSPIIRETYNRTDFGSIPFHYLPITKETKPQQEARIKAIVTATGADLVVLARYM